MKGLTPGRIVHFVLPTGEHRPAIIVKVWDKEAGTVNLQVFTDGANDQYVKFVDGDFAQYNVGTEHGIMWRTSVVYSEVPQTNTWHWPEYVE